MGKLLELARRYRAAVKIDQTKCRTCEGPLPDGATDRACSDECYNRYICDTSL